MNFKSFSSRLSLLVTAGFLTLAALSSCKSNPRLEARKEFKSNCKDNARKELLDGEKGHNNAIKAYCDCAADMVIDKMSDEEIKAYLDDPQAQNGFNEGTSQNCVETFKAEVRAEESQR